MQKTTTIRLPDELDEKLTQYAKAQELSKNQAVKKAIRELTREPKEAIECQR